MGDLDTSCGRVRLIKEIAAVLGPACFPAPPEMPLLWEGDQA